MLSASSLRSAACPLLAMFLGLALTSCETVGKMSRDLGFGGTDISVDAEVSPAPVLQKAKERPLVAAIAINDPDLQTILEQMCMRLGFELHATGAALKSVEDTKDQWFNALYQEVHDRNELFA